MEYCISVGLIALAAVLASVICIPMFKIIQLSGYKTRGVIAWWKGTSFDLIVRYIALAIFGFITMMVYIECFFASSYAVYCSVVAFIIFEAVFIAFMNKNNGSGVKYTGRVIRLFAIDMVLMLALGCGIAYATYYSIYCQVLVNALALLAPFSALIANIIATPFEKSNNAKYKKRAKAKLIETAPIVVGITGSYGKTTAKKLLESMLAKKYSILATPGSYNTPMGICKTINNSLNNEQIFIAEMGARYKGDIKELCDIVSPKYGIITAIGDMHIETMGSRKNVADVKYELAGGIPADGLLVLNGYNADCAELNLRTSACRKVVTGSGGISFENLVINADGTNFDMIVDGQKYFVRTELLGAHIPELVCVCAEIARECGVEINDIVSAVNNVPPVEHRLQLLKTENSAVTVIDDGYNSNPIGAKNALDVLKCFGGIKVIITPGFVELGAIEKSCNTLLGKQIAEVCDYAFVVGSRGADIKKGALSAGMDESKISCVSSRDEAVTALKNIQEAKTVLFENDLPDNIK